MRYSVFGIVLVVCIAAGSVWLRGFFTSTEFGTLVCTKSSELQFRTTPEGRFLAEATLQNTGGGVVRILSVTPSCGCTSAALGQVTLRPGEEQLLRFEIDPRVANSMAMRFDYVAGKVWLEAGFKIKGDFECVGSQRELSVRCSGAYQLPVTLPPGAADLGETSTDAGSFSRMLLVNHQTPVTAITVQKSSPGIAVSIESQHDAQHAMQLRLDPTVLRERNPEQEYLGLSVTLRVTLASGESINVPFPFGIRLVPPISVEPRRLVIGPVQHGEEIQGTVRLRPAGQSIRELRSASVDMAEPLAKVCHTESEGNVLRVDLELNSLDVGLHSLSIPLSVRHDADGLPHQMAIPVTVVVR